MSKPTREFAIDVRLDIFKSRGYRRLDITSVLKVFTQMQFFFGGNHGYYDRKLQETLGMDYHYDIVDYDGSRYTITPKNFEDFMSIEEYYVPENYIWFYSYYDYLFFNKEKDLEYAKTMLKLML